MAYFHSPFVNVTLSNQTFDKTILKIKNLKFKISKSKKLWKTTDNQFWSGNNLNSIVAKELLTGSRCQIWSLSDCNWTRPHNYVVNCVWKIVYKYVLIMSRTRFTVKPHSIVAWRFKSNCSHLNFRFCVCFKQGVHWHSGIGVWIHSETHTWHENNIQSNIPYQ